jgi:hypothetical protein
VYTTPEMHVQHLYILTLVVFRKIYKRNQFTNIGGYYKRYNNDGASESSDGSNKPCNNKWVYGIKSIDLLHDPANCWCCLSFGQFDIFHEKNCSPKFSNDVSVTGGRSDLIVFQCHQGIYTIIIFYWILLLIPKGCT